jgi:hypothetical protein
MSFIQKSDAVVINTKLTSVGRLNLSLGQLTFSTIEFGDSEVDYNSIRDNQTVFDGYDLSILRPRDFNPQIKYPVPVEPQLTQTKTTFTLNSFGNLVTNTTKQRGFFTGSTNSFTAITSSSHVLGITTALITGSTGSTTLRLASVTNITGGTMLLIDWRNPKLTSFSNLTGVIGENYPRPFLWYKVSSVTGNNVILDRALPNFNKSGSTQQALVYVYPPNNAVDNYYSTGNTASYWNYNTLAFDSTCNIGSNDDVPVWNFNIVYTKTPAGVSLSDAYYSEYYDSATYAGFKEYLQGASTNSGKTVLGIVHFTNKSISNYYGESFYSNTFKIDLPTIMYHAKTGATLGITLSASTIKNTLPTNLTGFTTEYYDLVETTSNNIVGKVFNNLRLAIIEDEEILNTLALKSDRSHTLPQPTWQLQNASGTDNPLLSSSFNGPTKYVLLSYLFTNSGYSNTQSFGLNGGIHCGYFQRYDQDSSNRVVRFQFKDDDLKFMASNISTSVGTGFSANRFYILSQIVTYGDDPLPESWYVYDYTPKLDNYTTWSANTIPASALSSNLYKFTYDDYTAGTTYNITSQIGTIPTNNNYLTTSQLGFGEESILLGNVNTSIQAFVYRSNIKKTLEFQKYNSSKNPTWVNGDAVYITEAGIYDSNNNLVAIGKLNTPVKKDSTKLFSIELDMDF